MVWSGLVWSGLVWSGLVCLWISFDIRCPNYRKRIKVLYKSIKKVGTYISSEAYITCTGFAYLIVPGVHMPTRQVAAGAEGVVAIGRLIHRLVQQT